MSEAGELRFSEMRSKRGQSPPPRPPEEPSFSAREFSSVRTIPSPPPPQPGADDSEEDGSGLKLPVDQWRIAMAIKRRWLWMVAAAFVGTGLGFAGGHLKVPYKLSVTFIMNPSSPAFDSGMVNVTYRPQQLTVATLGGLITSPDLIHRVAVKTQPPLAEAALKKSVEAVTDLKSELVTLFIAGMHPSALYELGTNYINEVLQMGRELQTSGTSNMNSFYKLRIVETEDKLTEANNELIKFQKEKQMVDPETETQSYRKNLGDLLSKLDETQIGLGVVEAEIAARRDGVGRINPLAQELAEAEKELQQLLRTVTEEHFSAKALNKRIAELRSKLSAEGNGPSHTGPTLSAADQERMNELLIEKAKLTNQLAHLDRQLTTLQERATGISSNGVIYARFKAKVDSLKGTLGKLTERQGEAQLYQDNAPGYYKLIGMEDIEHKARWKGVIKFAFIGCVLGMLLLGAVIAGFEVLDDRLKTTVDIERITGLPILATLGDLDTMSAAEKDIWAFRTWTALTGQLSPSPNHGMVCGFISSVEGEGRSTWINLLVNAASQRGFRVLTVATRPRESDSKTDQSAENTDEQQFGAAIGRALAETKTDSPETVATLTPQVLAFPAEVTRQFTGPNAPPIAHIPLPGWVWNLERRKQWQSALAHWRAIDNLVLLVELPPASLPESVLLAENLPQLIWLVDSGKARIRATREQLITLRHAKCRLVGAVLNHEPKPVFPL